MWYILGTVIFRCPPRLNDLSDTSPAICRPYLITKSHVQPYIEPYYQDYAAPYVDVARPYAQKVNQHVLTPASRFAKSTYHAYGAPRFDQAEQFGRLQWERSVLPQLKNAQARSQELYQSSAAPHIQKASEVFEPYYNVAKDNALYIHQKHIQPAYKVSKPFIERAYSTGNQFVTETGLPLVKQTWASTVIFVDGTLWPFMRGLYKQNVEPQVVMIGERLTRYRESRKLKAAMEAAGESMSQAPVQSITETNEVTGTVPSEDVPSQSVETPAEKTSLTSEQQIAAAREKIATDLHTWQEKFAIAADKGSDDLSKRVDEIMEGLISSEVHGEADGLYTALTTAAELEVTKAKAHIKRVVTSLPEDPEKTDLAHGEEQILGAVRKAGMSIRERAQALREWYNTFDAILLQRAEAASDTTLSVLDSISDLGLQEIGMRWAWMDGVTYQDWAKYHDLKKQFSSWRTEVEEVAMKHEKLEKAKNAGTEVVLKAMDVAEAAAKELGRLKEVGKWKIHAQDSSDNFESRPMQEAAALASSKIAEKAASLKEAVTRSSQSSTNGTFSSGTSLVDESVSTASEAVLGESAANVRNKVSASIAKAVESFSDTASKATDVAENNADQATASVVSAVPTDQANIAVGEADESGFVSSMSNAASVAVDEASSTLSSASQDASSKVWGGAMAQSVKEQKPILDDIIDDSDADTYSERLQKVMSEAGDRYTDATKAVTEALFGSTQGSAGSVTALAADQYNSAISAASSVLYGTSQGTVESAASVASDKFSEAVAA